MLSKKGKTLELVVALSLILIGVLLRFLPHPPNFAPIGALALFGGVYFSRKLALSLPLGAMILSDLFIGFYEPLLMLFVYTSFLLTVLLGFWLKRNKKWYNIAGGVVLASVLFFLLTNFAVWAFTPWYAKTILGLFQAFLMALPFFKNTLLSNLFYATCFFGVYELAYLWIKRKFPVPNYLYAD